MRVRISKRKKQMSSVLFGHFLQTIVYLELTGWGWFGCTLYIPVGGSHNRWQSSPVLCRHNTLYEKSQAAQTTFAFFLIDMLTLWVTLSSVGIAFRGDYVGLRRSQQWRDVLTGNSLHKMDRYVVFADIVNKINRSNGKVRLLPRHAACAAPD